MPNLLANCSDNSDPVAEVGEMNHSETTITKAFSGLTQVVSSARTLDATLDFIYEHFRSSIPFDRLGCALVERSGQRVIARWCRSNRPVHLNTNFSAPLSGSSLQLVLEKQCPRILNDLEVYLRNRPESHSTRLIVREGYRSSLTCPLIVEGQGIGFLFFSSVARNTYSQDHVSAFQKIAGLLSLSILVSTERDRSAAVFDACIDLLADTVGTAMPFARVSARRAEQLINRMVERMGLSDVTEFSRTARLCRIGWISAPPVPDDLQSHRALPGIPERPSLPSRAAFTSKLVGSIPGLDMSAEILALQGLSFAALRSRYGDISEHRPALGAALLRLVLDFDSLRLQGLTNSRALQMLRNNPEIYAPFLVDVLESIVDTEPQRALKEISVKELSDGMLLEAPIIAGNGNILVSSGRVINKTLRNQIYRYIQLGNRVREPLLVSLSAAPDIRQVESIESIALANR